jgi:hypothetical protein
MTIPTPPDESFMIQTQYGTPGQDPIISQEQTIIKNLTVKSPAIEDSIIKMSPSIILPKNILTLELTKNIRNLKAINCIHIPTIKSQVIILIWRAILNLEADLKIRILIKSPFIKSRLPNPIILIKKSFIKIIKRNPAALIKNITLTKTPIITTSTLKYNNLRAANLNLRVMTIPVRKMRPWRPRRMRRARRVRIIRMMRITRAAGIATTMPAKMMRILAPTIRNLPAVRVVLRILMISMTIRNLQVARATPAMRNLLAARAIPATRNLSTTRVIPTTMTAAAMISKMIHQLLILYHLLHHLPSRFHSFYFLLL